MTPASERFQIVMTTAGSDEQARSIARGLVDRLLAACVSIVPHACSVYRWKGEIQQEVERILVIKTSQRLFSRVRDAIRELHSYEVPEVLAIPVAAGDETYLAWPDECLGEEG